MAAPANEWRGKVAVVTGSSAGIGRHLAVELVTRLGMRVAGCARRLRKLTELGAELRAAGFADNFLPLQCDLTKDASIVHMFEEVDKHWGRVDVMINNAGIGHTDTVLEGSTRRWRDMFEVNCLALLTCTREAVRRMGSEGFVINISSMSGHRLTSPSTHVYCATKFAVKAITEATRRELRNRDSAIRIGSVSPGLVRTEFAAAHMKSKRAAEELYATAPALQACDITSAVLFMLLSPANMEVHDVLVRPTAQKF